MWFVLGMGAIAAAVLNIILTLFRREASWARFLSMALTCLTMCAEYGMVARWVLREDWSALMDVVPAMDKMLWILVTASILINSVSLFLGPKKQPGETGYGHRRSEKSPNEAEKEG